MLLLQILATVAFFLALLVSVATILWFLTDKPLGIPWWETVSDILGVMFKFALVLTILVGTAFGIVALMALIWGLPFPA